VKAVNQLVGAPVESHVLLQCIVEAYPKPLNTWYRNEADTKLYHGEKYLVTESMINSFTWQMNLTVKNLHKSDFQPYICLSENALGKSDARIRLQELHLPPKLQTTTPTPYIYTTVKPPRNRNKQQQQHNHQHKAQHEGKGGGSSGSSSNNKDAIGGLVPNQIQAREIDAISASEVFTQAPVKSNGGDKNRNNQPSSIIPSRPPWVVHHNSSGKLQVSFIKYFSVLIIILQVLAFA
jgi:hypothetical protein